MHEPVTDLDEGQVADYLERHPEFFTRNEALLEGLSIPHPQRGKAISLLERKVDLQREQLTTLRSRLTQLTRNAQRSEEMLERVQGLMLDFLASEGVEEAATRLCDWLLDDFRAEAVAVRLMADGEHDSPTLVARSDPAWGRFRALLDGQTPLCGRFDRDQLGFLFGEESAVRIGSAVVIPLCAPGAASDECAGLLAIGSHDPSRFHSHMGTLFLGHMGAIIGAELARRLARL